MAKSCICCFPILFENSMSKKPKSEDASEAELLDFEEHCCDKCMSKNGNFNLALFTFAIILYLIMGAVLFHSIEHGAERRDREFLRLYLTEFIGNHSACMKTADLEKLLEVVTSVTNKGISPLRNVTNDPNWSFGQAFFYSGTLITTVGYGHVSPVTETGKAFTIVYCVIGIPLTLALLTAFVERLKIPATWLLALMHRACGSGMSLANVRMLHLLLLFIILVSVLFIVPASIFTYIEPDWTFLDAFYYCFISLTTIGLGDYIPGDHPDTDHRALYKVFATGVPVSGAEREGGGGKPNPTI